MSFSEQNINDLFREFSSSSRGLTNAKAKEHLEKYGRNTLPEKQKSRLKMFLLQFYSPLIFILFVAVVISLSLPLFQDKSLEIHDLIDSIVIFSILILNACFGFFQELKAENTLQALKEMQPHVSSVLRNGKKQQIEREEIVPGDILALAEGDRIPADARIIEEHQLKVIESALTGESVAVKKDAKWQGKGVMADQKNMIFSGTSLVTGRVLALVVSTGGQTQIGKIATLVSQSHAPKTPLEKRMEKLGRQMGIIVLVLCFAVFGLAYFHGISLLKALMVAVALAVSAVPEGLPAVMTISLAVGVGIMAKKKAIVRELRAVETLGSVTVIASDKTGTITENRMSVATIYADGQYITETHFSRFRKTDSGKIIMDISANCNDAEFPNFGDPTEIALLEFASSSQKRERVNETPFSSDTKWMSTTHIINGEKIEFIKGAPEIIAEFCEEKARDEIEKAAEKMASEGLRTIAFAVRKEGNKKAEFKGISGLLDPPRKTAAMAILKAKKAGIRTIMITGDHVLTAITIAKKVGLSGSALTGAEIENMSPDELQKAVQTTNIFARVSPEHKVRICVALQKNGHVVAMTGDGVNDAPAIHSADVGISMGKVGTSVARQASDLVLMDDNYATIVSGIEEGRRVFANIKKSISFLMRTNFASIFLIIFSVTFSFPLPLLPIHILFINLVTDSLPALSLAMEPAEENIMSQKPRSPHEGFLHHQWRFIISLGILAAFFEFVVFIITLDNIGLSSAQTVILATSIFIELTIIFSVRSDTRIFKQKKSLSRNPWVFLSVIIGLALFLIVLYTPLNGIMRLSLFPPQYWSFPVFMAICMFVASEWMKGNKKKLQITN